MLADIDWNTGTVMMVMIFSVPIVAIVAEAWRKVEQARSQNELKRSMVERGMSANDIERVIAAQPPKK
jgi:hypothetical protein